MENIPPSIVWEGQSYRITDEPVEIQDIGNNLGEVIRKISSTSTPNTHGESNVLEKGTKIFESAIRVEDKDYRELVIQINNKKYIKAYPMLGI
ncbi:hypothetical protein ACQKNS_23365 [Peribacillus sp. NPDC094092]|uniref:hypothetical protein n=1 Tax=Peribacillus sp. NPDC094092 TaxID=3390611 RepID=UPI003D07D612